MIPKSQPLPPRGVPDPARHHRSRDRRCAVGGRSVALAAGSRRAGGKAGRHRRSAPGGREKAAARGRRDRHRDHLRHERPFSGPPRAGPRMKTASPGVRATNELGREWTQAALVALDDGTTGAHPAVMKTWRYPQRLGFIGTSHPDGRGRRSVTWKAMLFFALSPSGCSAGSARRMSSTSAPATRRTRDLKYLVTSAASCPRDPVFAQQDGYATPLQRVRRRCASTTAIRQALRVATSAHQRRRRSRRDPAQEPPSGARVVMVATYKAAAKSSRSEAERPTSSSPTCPSWEPGVRTS